MNVLLDSTVLYVDPFFCTPYMKLLIKLAERKKINIFLSKLVIEEVKINKKFEESNKLLFKGINTYNKFLPENKRIDIEKFDFGKHFNDFTLEMENKSLIKIVDIENNILPSILEKYLKKRKPFGVKKDSFKDAVIWLSYLKIINIENNDSVFISNNTKDYADEDKTKLHKEIVLDVNNPSFLEYYTDIMSFFSGNEKMKQYKYLL